MRKLAKKHLHSAKKSTCKSTNVAQLVRPHQGVQRARLYCHRGDILLRIIHRGEGNARRRVAAAAVTHPAGRRRGLHRQAVGCNSSFDLFRRQQSYFPYDSRCRTEHPLYSILNHKIAHAVFTGILFLSLFLLYIHYRKGTCLTTSFTIFYIKHH